MSDWKVRHEGSPKASEGLTYEEALQGLLDGRWEPTDEVMGPQDADWVALENHPQFADVALELEPPVSKPHDDETRLDIRMRRDSSHVLTAIKASALIHRQHRKCNAAFRAPCPKSTRHHSGTSY